MRCPSCGAFGAGGHACSTVPARVAPKPRPIQNSTARVLDSWIPSDLEVAELVRLTAEGLERPGGLAR